MTRPGTNVAAQTQLPPSTPPVSTGTWFVAGVTAKGPTTPTPVFSFQQYQQVFGLRTTTSALMSDAAESYFNEGGATLVVARTVGPGAVTALIALEDAASSPSITVSAIGPGAYANGYQVVVAGSPTAYTITIEDASSNVLEVSNTLTSVADAVAYGVSSSVVRIAATGSVSPAVGTFTLATGADDLGSITTTQYSNSLATFAYTMGPGQVSVPGVTTTAVLTAVANHGVANNRVAYGDLPDTANASSGSATSTLTGDATPVRALGVAARNIALWTPWIDIAPVVGGLGNRAVPPSAFAAAKAAVNDAATGNPNVPTAGVNGVLSTPLDVRQTFADSDRQTLNLAGVNVIRAMNGGFRIYGFRTATNPTTDPLYWMLNNVRLDMYITAAGQAIAEDYVFSQIDGQGLDAARYGGDLSLMMNNLYSPLNALYGDTAADAFTVDTSSDINTPTSEQGGNLIAVLAYRRAPEAEQVNLNLVRVPITQAV